MLEAFTFEERQQLLSRRREALQRYEQAISFASLQLPWSNAEADALAKAEIAFGAVQAAEADYFGRLPRVAVGCCPFDGLPLMRSIDPFGMDGPWWHPGAVVEEAVPCPHFCVLLGAVEPQPDAPLSEEFEIFAGPDAPYVVPRLLQHKTMTAVVAQLEFPHLPKIYTIAYFAERRPLPELLTADWPRRNFVYTTQRSTHGWHPSEEFRDFDILPWLQKGKLRWCEPGSNNLILAQNSVECCPLLGPK